MGAGRWHGPQQDDRAALWCEGPAPRTARVPATREERRGAGPPVPWLRPLAPVYACSAWKTEGWEPVRTALLGERAQVMTTEVDPAAVELKGFLFLLSFSPVGGGTDVFFNFCFCL